jgi:hypothetical protein
MSKRNRIRGYMIFAAGFFFVWFLFKLGGNPDIGKSALATAVDVFLSMAATILTVEYFVPAFFYKRRYGLFSLLFGIVLLTAGSVIIGCQLALMGGSIFAYHRNMIKYHEHFFYWFWSDLICGSYFLVAFLCLAGMAIRVALDRISRDRQVQVLETEKALAELTMLKHQINPHFIFNTLNTVYYRIDKNNVGARQILEQFSALLRYQLYESNDPEVRIEKELNFLRSYIGVQQQRLNQTCAVNVSGFEDLTGFAIAPNLLLPIVENCFKHISFADDGNCFILIRAERKADAFEFTTENTAQHCEDGHGPGIGLDNVKRRLELLYKGRYSYRILKEEYKFSTFLSISIT